MTLCRRRFLHLAAGAAALPAVPRLASAQAYPARPVRIIVGFAPGGSADILARLIGQWLSGRLGQPFVIENRPGAGTTIATEAVVKATPDGYTLLLVPAAAVTSALLYDKLNFNLLRDIVPVASISREPQILALHPSVPANTISEFIAYAKANPGKISMGSGGNGTPAHIAGELFKMMAGVNLVHVPYRGAAPALTDLIGGHIQVMFVAMASGIEYARAGKLRSLAVTTAMRSEALPDVPVLSDFVAGYESSAWYGLGAPRNTPAEIVATLNTEINAGLANSTIKARLVDLGSTPLVGLATDFGQAHRRRNGEVGQRHPGPQH
jgi:tripartite-type tricarboxylate transporter receptor subunit TctC